MPYFYIHGGGAGKMFKSECKECKIFFNWDDLVVEGSDWDWSNVEARRCIPCHEEKYTKLNIKRRKD